VKLTITDMGFGYSSASVLNDICLELAQAEILGIVGPNGAGKSTLVKCINNILRPQRGSVMLDGQAISQMNQMEIARQIGYVPQSAGHIFPTTVFDTVLMGRRPHASWRSSPQDVNKVVEILELLEISDLAMRNVNELSGGEQQRVMLARALVQEANLLLLDEPTSNLDIKHQLEVLDTITRLVDERNLSVIMVIHDLNLASRYTDRVMMLKQGRIFAVGDPVSVFTPENIFHVYGVEALVKHESGIPYVMPISSKKTCADAHVNEFDVQELGKIDVPVVLSPTNR
jgi:iron complex transport system ATP-binding protein